MAKKSGSKGKRKKFTVKMVNPDTGYFFIAKRNPKNLPDKLTRRKYDPTVRKHVEFKEVKLK